MDRRLQRRPTPYSNFDIAAYLTEIILLGCVALRTGKKLDWDGPNMKATNASGIRAVRETHEPQGLEALIRASVKIPQL